VYLLGREVFQYAEKSFGILYFCAGTVVGTFSSQTSYMLGTDDAILYKVCGGKPFCHLPEAGSGLGTLPVDAPKEIIGDIGKFKFFFFHLNGISFLYV